MEFLEFKTPSKQSCTRCTSFLSSRILTVVLVGILIGWVGTFFVEMPPAVVLMQGIDKQQSIEERLETLETRAREIDVELQYLRDQLNKQ